MDHQLYCSWMLRFSQYRLEELLEQLKSEVLLQNKILKYIYIFFYMFSHILYKIKHTIICLRNEMDMQLLLNKESRQNFALYVFCKSFWCLIFETYTVLNNILSNRKYLLMIKYVLVYQVYIFLAYDKCIKKLYSFSALVKKG